MWVVKRVFDDKVVETFRTKEDAETYSSYLNGVKRSWINENEEKRSYYVDYILN